MPALDLLVLGAGPAGLAAAIEARRRGLSVTLIERHGKFRPQPGETLHPGIEPLFEKLGVADEMRRAACRRHSGIWIFENGARRFEAYGEDANGPWLGFQIKRPALNEALLARALALGAKLLRPAEPESLIRDGARVTGAIIAGARVEARFTLDATGRRGWLPEKLGIAAKACSPPLRVTYGWGADARADLEGMPEFSILGDGWDWHAPLGPGEAAWARLRRGETAGGIDAAWRRRERFAGPGFFLCGEAAAVLDPSSSHGVLRALMSGMLAAHLATAAISGAPEQQCEDHYSEWLSGQFKADTEALRALAGGNPAPETADVRRLQSSGKPAPRRAGAPG